MAYGIHFVLQKQLSLFNDPSFRIGDMHSFSTFLFHARWIFSGASPLSLHTIQVFVVVRPLMKNTFEPRISKFHGSSSSKMSALAQPGKSKNKCILVYYTTKAPI